MKNEQEVSLVVPVFNEQDLIDQTVKIFLQSLCEVCNKYELIVVDDASTDNTPQILNELVLKYPDKLKVIKNKKNVGGGRSLLNGFKQARFSYIATNFADRPFDVKELKNILPLFNKGIDFVVVCRIDRSANTFYRKVTSLVNYYLIRFMFGFRVSDFQFVQVYRKEMICNIEVNANRTFVPPELIIRALAKGYKMVEYKAKFHARTHGIAKCGHPRIIFQTLFDIFKFWITTRMSKINTKDKTY